MSLEICRLSRRRAYVKRDSDCQTANLTAHEYNMAVVNAYEQYFAAKCTANGVERHAARVALTVSSEAGRIVCEASVTFFPHNSEDDFAVSYDAHYSNVLYDGSGRRSKKRERAYMENIRNCIDRLAEDAGGKVFWDKPLREAGFG